MMQGIPVMPYTLYLTAVELLYISFDDSTGHAPLSECGSAEDWRNGRSLVFLCGWLRCTFHSMTHWSCTHVAMWFSCTFHFMTRWSCMRCDESRDAHFTWWRNVVMHGDLSPTETYISPWWRASCTQISMRVYRSHPDDTVARPSNDVKRNIPNVSVILLFAH